MSVDVPAYPIVEIEVSGEAVTVDGVVVDRGSVGGPDATVAMHLGVQAAARRVALPLGRPVRATLRSGDDEKRLVIHPDGSVSDVEDTFPVVSLVAPAGSRGAPISRPPRRAVRPSWHYRRKQVAVVAAYVALAAVLVGGILTELSRGEMPSPLTDDEPLAQPEDALARVQPVVQGSRVRPLPAVRDVVVTPGTGGFRVRLTTGRASRVTVRAAPVSGAEAERLWTIRTPGATTRTLDVGDLPAGAYRWVVRSPGERPVTGRIVVDSVSEPPTVTVDPTPVAPPPTSTPVPQPPADNGGTSGGSSGGNGGGNGSGGGDGGGTDSSLPGPSGPVDPDEPAAP